MHPMRQFSRPSLELMEEDEIKAHKRRTKTRKQRLQSANEVFQFARSVGFEILVTDVKNTITKLRDKLFSDKVLGAKEVQMLRLEAHAWKKVLKKLNGYLQQKDLIQKAMKKEAESTI